MEVVVRLVALLVVLLVGAGLRASGILDARRTDRLNAVAYYVALPTLIFISTYDRAIGELLLSSRSIQATKQPLRRDRSPALRPSRSPSTRRT